MEVFYSDKRAMAGIAVLALLAAWIYGVLNGPLARLPGPWHTKWTDICLKYQTVKGRRPKYVHELHEKYGPIVRIGPDEASIMDTAAAQVIYSVKGEYHKSTFYQKLVPDVQSVFSTIRVDVHRRMRRLLSSSLSETGLKVHRAAVDRKARLAVQRMGEEMERRGATDVFHWSLSMATDVIGELSFGESFRTLETGVKSQYMRDLEAVAFAGSLRITLPWLVRLADYVPVPVVRRAVANQRRMGRYARESLARHYRLVEEQGAAAAPPTLLSRLYQAGGGHDGDGDGDGLAFREVRDNAQAYIVAGSDTTANTLTYLLWLVCARPPVRARLVAELAALPAGFGDADLKPLPYLAQVIEETLRLYSAVPMGLPRAVPPEGARLCGHWVPGGCTVSVQAYSMHRNPAVFPDPLKFDPSRWAAPTPPMKESFFPFGGGSRVCIGSHLARMELRLTTAHFFRTFPHARVSTLEGFGDEDMEPAMFFLLTPKRKMCLIEAR